MRKYFRLCILLLLMGIFAGCSNKEAVKASNNIEDDPDDYGYGEPASGMGFIITNEDVFETGYYHVQYDTFYSAYVYFTSNNEADSDVEWRVYVVDHELDDEEIDELLTKEPIAINSGSADIYSGQWIYVFCSVNSKTAESPTNSTFEMYSFADYA